MTDTTTYNVITSGELLNGFEPAQVQEALARLFSIELEKADTLMGSRQVIKKGADLTTAETYKSQLEGIGMVVTLEELAPALGSSLSLVPLDDDEPMTAQSETAPASQPSATPNTITCPKCATEQPATTEQCPGCGIFLHKVMNQATQVAAPRQSPKTQPIDDTVYGPGEALNIRSIAAGLGAALLGALIWKYIAIATEYEFGFIAWIVGGVVGVAIARQGSSGHVAGFAGAVLALVAILGGKYMIVEDFKDDIVANLGLSQDDFQQAYDQEMAAAKAYTDILDDKALREFMVTYAYTESYDAEDVTQEEISRFKTEDEPRLISYAYGPPSFDTWYQDNIRVNLDDISSSELVKGSLDVFDLLFLLLGVSTAYRIGRGWD